LHAVAQEMLTATPEPVGQLPPLSVHIQEWRQAAASHNARVASQALLAEAEKAWGESQSEEDWLRLKALEEFSPNFSKS
jgi:hypothetical protein